MSQVVKALLVTAVTVLAIVFVVAAIVQDNAAASAVSAVLATVLVLVTCNKARELAAAVDRGQPDTTDTETDTE